MKSSSTWAQGVRGACQEEQGEDGGVMSDKTISPRILNPREFRLKPGVYCGDTTYILLSCSATLYEHNLGHGNLIEISVENDGLQ